MGWINRKCPFCVSVLQRETLKRKNSKSIELHPEFLFVLLKARPITFLGGEDIYYSTNKHFFGLLLVTWGAKLSLLLFKCCRKCRRGVNKQQRRPVSIDFIFNCCGRVGLRTVKQGSIIWHSLTQIQLKLIEFAVARQTEMKLIRQDNYFVDKRTREGQTS